MVKSIRSRGMTNAERQAKWRAAHPSAPADRARAAARSGMMVALIPRGPLDLRELPPRPSPRIEETLELLRTRFEDNVKSQH